MRVCRRSSSNTSKRHAGCVTGDGVARWWLRIHRTTLRLMPIRGCATMRVFGGVKRAAGSRTPMRGSRWMQRSRRSVVGAGITRGGGILVVRRETGWPARAGRGI
jgi:hypothetical protein